VVDARRALSRSRARLDGGEGVALSVGEVGDHTNSGDFPAVTHLPPAASHDRPLGLRHVGDLDSAYPGREDSPAGGPDRVVMAPLMPSSPSGPVINSR
jgi:hypothetical protein